MQDGHVAGLKYTETLSLWLKANSGRGKRDRRTKGQMWQALCELGYTGSYGCAFARLWKIQEGLGRCQGGRSGRLVKML